MPCLTLDTTADSDCIHQLVLRTPTNADQGHIEPPLGGEMACNFL